MIAWLNSRRMPSRVAGSGMVGSSSIRSVISSLRAFSATVSCLSAFTLSPVVESSGVPASNAGAVAAYPLAFLRFGGHSVDDSVDDGFALELGEDAEELHEHAAD
ncbi:hypothetical protein ACPPVO_52940 [Dactylosporangium sp. McL0621]|uniref:hypothetical protein n=1 Tax=Dactylosporangium sp. McL0621 TaxID=3415678 RepID=UPI003CF3E8F7